jgi:DNA-directed RNA polymerase subunit RPC12/RpoP
LSSHRHIKCRCGQRVLKGDVLQSCTCWRINSPGFIYLKYRCSRCRAIEERFVALTEWDENALREVPDELTADERRRFLELDPIGVDEIVSFKQSLRDGRLSDLIGDYQSRRNDAPSPHLEERDHENDA